MAVLTGNNGKITINSVQLLNIKNYSLEIKADTVETTAMGNDTRQYLKGLSSWSGSADVYVDMTNLDSANAAYISKLITTGGSVGDAGVTCIFNLDNANYPSNEKFTGTAIVTGFSVKSSMDGMVEGSVSFQGSGALSYTA